MDKEGFANHLDTIWRESGRDMAVSFLQRAVSSAMTLAELQRALGFEGVVPHLAEIELHDILPSRPRAQEAARSATTGPSPARPQARARRSRRTGDEMRQIRELLLRLIMEEPGSLDTVQLVELLGEHGHKVDTIIVNSMLKALQDAGKIVTLGGKPKSWRKASPKSGGSAEKGERA